MRYRIVAMLNGKDVSERAVGREHKLTFTTREDAEEAVEIMEAENDEYYPPDHELRDVIYVILSV